MNGRRVEKGLLIFAGMWFIYAGCLVLLLDKIYYAYLSVSAIYISVCIFDAIQKKQKIREEKNSVIYIISSIICVVSLLLFLVAAITAFFRADIFSIFCIAGCVFNAAGICSYAFERKAYSKKYNRVLLNIGFLLALLFPLLMYLEGMM